MELALSSVVRGYLLFVLLSISCALVGCSRVETSTPGAPSTAPPALTTTSAPTISSLQMDALVSFIVNQEASGRKADGFIVQVENRGQPVSGPLRYSRDLFHECWLSHAGTLSRCTFEENAAAFRQETTRPWKHYYILFSIVALDANFSKVVVRLDQMSDPKASIGYLITFIQSGGQWREESRQVAFVS